MSASTQTIGQRIRDCRLERDWSQADLGRRAGTSRSAVHQWENDLTAPDKDKLRKLSGAFGKSIGWILTGNDQDEMYSDDEVEICKMYRQMTPENRAAYMLVGRNLAK